MIRGEGKKKSLSDVDNSGMTRHRSLFQARLLDDVIGYGGRMDDELQNLVGAVMGAYGQMHFWAGIGFFFYRVLACLFFWILAIQGKIYGCLLHLFSLSRSRLCMILLSLSTFTL